MLRLWDAKISVGISSPKYQGWQSVTAEHEQSCPSREHLWYRGNRTLYGRKAHGGELQVDFSGIAGKQPGLLCVLLCLSVLSEGFCMLQISRSTEVLLPFILLLICRNSPYHSHLSPLHHHNTKSKTQFAP